MVSYGKKTAAAALVSSLSLLTSKAGTRKVSEMRDLEQVSGEYPRATTSLLGDDT